MTEKEWRPRQGKGGHIEGKRVHGVHGGHGCFYTYVQGYLEIIIDSRGWYCK